MCVFFFSNKKIVFFFTMNTIEISKVLSSHPVTREYFYGVYARDMIPKYPILNRPCGIIANLDNSNLPGSHWICMFLPKYNSNDYGNVMNEIFDSFSNPVISDFEGFLSRNGGTHFRFSSRQIQSDLSELCGQYSCLYFYYRCLNKSFDEFLKIFDYNDLDGNDKCAKKMYNRFFSFSDRNFVCQSSFRIPNQLCKPRLQK